MDSLQNILRELQELAPHLAALRKEGQNPFKMPESYMVNLQNALHEDWQEVEELKQLAPKLLGIVPANYFKVPDNYFEHLYDEVRGRIETNFDENTALLNVEKENPFTVPNTFFNQFESSVLDKIKDIDANQEENVATPFLDGIEKTNPFEVPNNYFAQLEENILEEAKESSSILEDIGKENAFTVPDAYFDQLTDGILQKLTTPNTNQKGGRVIQMNNNWSIQKGLRYAMSIAAAIAVFFVGLQIINLEKSNSVDNPLAMNKGGEKGVVKTIPTPIPNMEQVNDFFGTLSVEELTSILQQDGDGQIDDVLNDPELVKTINDKGIKLNLDLNKEELKKELLLEDIDIDNLDLDDLDLDDLNNESLMNLL